MSAPKGNQFAKGNSGGGRTSSYDPEQIPLIEKMCELGATDLDIADSLGVSESTIRLWKTTHKEFAAALKVGKESVDKNVERSLYRRAMGFEHDTIKIFCDAKSGEVTQVPYREVVPPDTTACIFWLKNRKGKDWRDKSEVEIPGIAALADRIAKARKRS